MELDCCTLELEFVQRAACLLRCWDNVVKLRQGSGKEGKGMALKAKGLKAETLA